MIPTPACFVIDGAITELFYQWRAFTGPDGVQHPSTAWQFWSAEDWATMMPGVSALPLIDESPNPATHIFSRNAEADWTIEAARVVVTYTSRAKTSEELAAEVTAELAGTLASDLAKIDADAENCRLRFITPGAGQAITYLRKEEQARAWVAAGRPSDASAYPFLTDEATATGQSVGTLADTIIANADIWGAQIGPAIEALRLGGKASRRAATTIAERLAAITINWPSP